MAAEMIHCMQCGAKLIRRYLASEGKDIKYCPQCEEYRFEPFNTAVSMIITDTSRTRFFLIRQYGGDRHILTAGYVNKGEDAEDAVVREIREETGMTAVSVRFNRSHYYAPSNTLMLNFTAVVADPHVHANSEVDSWNWFTEKEARRAIRPGSLAEAFLLGYLDGEYHFPDTPSAPYHST